MIPRDDSNYRNERDDSSKDDSFMKFDGYDF